MTMRVATILRAGALADAAGRKIPFDLVVLTRDERHVRRRTIVLEHGDKVLIDLLEATLLDDRDVLVLEDGRHVEVIAADQQLYEITGKDGVHLSELAWHIGNRHLPAQIEAGRILIERDHVIKAMLEGLGAKVADVVEPFGALRGAYSGGHSHHHHADAGHTGGDHGHHHEGDRHHGHHHHDHHGGHGHHHD